MGYLVFVSDEYLVVQDNINVIGQVVEKLIVDFEQAAYEECLSRSDGPKATRCYRRVTKKINARAKKTTSPSMKAKIHDLEGTSTRSSTTKVTSLNEGSSEPRRLYHLQNDPQMIKATLPPPRCNYSAEHCMKLTIFLVRRPKQCKLPKST